MTPVPPPPANEYRPGPPRRDEPWLEIWHVALDAMGPSLEALDAAHGFLPIGEQPFPERTLDTVLPAADRLRNRTRARIALRALMFSRAKAIEAKGRSFVVDGHGKPALESGYPAFNMSHSHNRCLIAFGWPGPMGVDLELPRTVQLGPVRQALIVAAGNGLAPVASPRVKPPPVTLEQQFLRAWTRLEAIAKARGDGIGHLLTTLGITASGVKELTSQEVEARATALITSSGLEIADVTMPDDSFGAIAAPASTLPRAPACRRFTMEDVAFPAR